MSRILKTEESLMNYAAWYAMRYFPSFRKLEESLAKKSGNNTALVDSVMRNMKEYISEERTVEGLVRMYIEQSKTCSYIEQKLKVKKFEKDIIDFALEAHGDSFGSWKNYESAIVRKIGEYLQKSKSRKYISWILVRKYPNFKSEIATLLDQMVPSEKIALRKEFEKLSKKHDINTPKEQQKIFQKLYLKGFSCDDIKQVIKDEE